MAELHEQATEAQAEIEATRKQTAELLNDWSAKYENLLESSTTSIEHATTEARTSIDTSLNAAKEKFDTSTGLLSTSVAEMRQELADLTDQTTAQLSKHEKNLDSKISEALTEFEENSSTKLADLSTEFNRQAEAIAGKAHTSVAENDAELKRLTVSLEDLESRIRQSIERATGFTLFHSFQKRQLDLAESKKYWARMLAGTVAISLAASGIFIWNLQYVHTYNAAFYMKLSISLPLIYAIAFCSVQYSRERRLEEEYAFKSSISISLEPYQKLVRGLVDSEKPEEMAKYTAFIIESVNRVFTSPTEHIFDDGKQDKNSTEKLIKALGEFIDPFVKIIKSK